MSFWDYQQEKIVAFPTTPCKDYPGWEEVDCGCSNGLEWGGEYPRECRHCGGNGVLYHHIKSGVLAQYPGGPFAGRVN